MTPPRLFLAALSAVLLASCVTGSKIRADTEVIQNDIEKAERSGARKCAPRELATARAELDFANGELFQGNSFRARDHIQAADAAVKKAMSLSKDCGPKQILVREQDQAPDKRPPVVVRIEETDTDNDGVPDKDDKCPDRAEDKDGFQDEDGCPENDNDQDEVLDGNDKCPTLPGPFSNQGCPTETPKDADEDGVVDAMDKCPGQKEDKDGFEDDDGCPDLDNDADGLMDVADKCPNAKGPIREEGCPITDRDGDGVDDTADRCPGEPEDKDGFQDTDGCPDLDNDQDGVPDSADKCPNQTGVPVAAGCPVDDRDQDGVPDDKDRCPLDAEDKDGFKDEDGCPDYDNDQDGMPDNQDKCPDASGPLQNQGCPVTDRDGDGVEDAQDKCPGQAEDKDGFEDEDGCADPDNDKDGVPDTQDKCPNDAGPVEAQGCADVDRDSDGVVDRLDKCPTSGEDRDGFEDDDGCADPDNDKDGVPDVADKCPNDLGLVENFGCPDADKDGDGVVDRQDKCPEEFGRDGKGCPKKYKTVVVQKNRIQINKQILFGTGSAKIVGRDSQAVLADVALALQDNPQIKKIRIEGHTDSAGADATNLRLSQKRADAVMAALIRAGVDPDRMTAVGFGEAQPIASNATKAGRAENRRTEFNIVEQ